MPYPTPTDSANYLEADAAITSTRYGSVSGVARTFDTGSSLIAFPSILFVSFSAMDTSSGNENYTIKLFGSNDSFATQVELFSASINAIPTTDEAAFNVSNQADGVIYRYLRLQVVPSGTTPSVTLDAWIMHVDDLDEMTLAQLTKYMSIAAQRLGNTSIGFAAWAGGVADGGPEGDGRYPLYDGNDNVYLVPCPARIALSAGLSYEAFIALTAHTTPFADTSDGPDIMIGNGAGALRRAKLFLFAARRTADLQDSTALLSDELIPSIKASNGLERRIAVGQIMRQSLGMVNALQYGVIPDCVVTRHSLAMDSGDNVVECTDPIFIPSDVGKSIMVGNAISYGVSAKGTITAYLDTSHVTVSFTAGHTFSGQDGAWGTNNTVALQNAINACFNPRGVYNYGAILLLPQGNLLTGAVRYLPRMGISGHGFRQSLFVRWDDTFLTEGGQFPRWDGDVDPYPITRYANGDYYIDAYPKSYTALNNYYGDYIPEIAPTLCNRMGTDIYGETWSFYGTADGPARAGWKTDSDFNVFHDFAFDGGRYNNTRLMPGFEFRGGIVQGDGIKVFHQIDPQLRMSNVGAFNCGYFGMRIFGQTSGTLIGLDSGENGLCGFWHQAFDCNISNCYFMGNGGPGIVCDGANNNLTTIKVSFNGQGSQFNWMWGDLGTMSNIYIQGGGTGNNWNNMRVQESWGPSITVMARGNEFTGCHADDTGCQYPRHATPEWWRVGSAEWIADMAANMQWITPVVYVGASADDLRLNDFGFGGLVHVGDNYASHAIWFEKDGSNEALATTGTMYSKSISTYFNPGALTGVYAPNEWGSDDGVYPLTADLLLNNVDLATL